MKLKHLRSLFYSPISASLTIFPPHLSAHAYHSVFGEYAGSLGHPKLHDDVELVMCSKLWDWVTCYWIRGDPNRLWQRPLLS